MVAFIDAHRDEHGVAAARPAGAGRAAASQLLTIFQISLSQIPKSCL